MTISVFGTGEVGTAVASKLKSLGHDTVFGSRHPGSDRGGIPVLSHADAAAHGNWIVNALHGEDAMAVLVPLDLGGKLLVDIGNWRSAIDSPIVETLGESLQRALPRTRVVKAMNFASAQLMGHPEKLEGINSTFLAAHNAGARAEVRQLLETLRPPRHRRTPRDVSPHSPA